MHNFPLFEPPNTWAQRWNKPWPLDLETCATTQLLSYESNKYIEQWSTTTRNSLNTNGIFDGIIPSTIWGRHYRQKLIRQYGHRHIPTECWELKKRGQFADAEVIAGIFYRRNHRGIQKRQLRTVTRPVHRWKILTESPRDSKRQLRMVTRPIHRWKILTESLRDSKWQLRTVTCPIYRQNSRHNSPSVNPSAKVNISPISPSSSPPFSSSSQLSPTTNNQPPSQKKFPPSQRNKSYILKSSCNSIRVLIYLWIFISFCK